MSRAELDPAHIMQVGMGFWPSKTVLSAVELELFTQLGDQAMTGEEIGERLDLHPRAIYDFLDTLVALRFLERDGDGTDGRSRNTTETAAFLDKRSPTYIGGILEMCNARLYRFWGDLTEALQTGKAQNEIKSTTRRSAMSGVPQAGSARSWPSATRTFAASATTCPWLPRSQRRPSPPQASRPRDDCLGRLLRGSPSPRGCHHDGPDPARLEPRSEDAADQGGLRGATRVRRVRRR
jgi:hypothetical protein